MQQPIDTLTEIARKLRCHALRMVYTSQASHIGSCLSMADIIACLYWRTLRIDPLRPKWNDRDRFILSKGHAAALLYAALAERGFFPTVDLETYCQNGSSLTGHVTSSLPGIELSTGSLGHGLPVASGMALAAKRGRQPFRIFVLLGDGELDEGSNWEAILFAAHHRLDNLIAIVDWNGIQSFGRVEEVLTLGSIGDKLRSFGWAVHEVDGHDMKQLAQTFDAVPAEPGKPVLILARTTKGKGVSFMEDRLAWHYKSPNATELAAALNELGVAA